MAKPLLLLLGVVLGAGVLVGRADPYPSPPALTPADLATLVVSATPERSRYFLGETVRVRYSVTNRGATPLTVRRDNDTAFWRPTSLHVAAFDADTGAAVPEAPGGFDLFNHRYGRSHTLAPGETLVKAITTPAEPVAEAAAEGETTPSGAVAAEDVLTKGNEDRLSQDEVTEVQSLLVKAQTLMRDYNVEADGYEEAVDAMNEGGFNRQVLEGLRKGVEAASAGVERLVKA